VVQPVKLLSLQTFYDQESDPQFRVTLIVKDPTLPDPVTISGACDGDISICPEQVAVANDYTLEEV
jgi:hypothetical protein